MSINVWYSAPIHSFVQQVCSLCQVCVQVRVWSGCWGQWPRRTSGVLALSRQNPWEVLCWWDLAGPQALPPHSKGGPEYHVSLRGAVAGATECSFPLTPSHSAFWLWNVLDVPFKAFLATEQGHPRPGLPPLTTVPCLSGLCLLSPILSSGLEPV